MALPVSLSPPVAYPSQMPAAFGGSDRNTPPDAGASAPTESPSPVPASRDMTLLPADRMAAGPEQKTVTMVEQQSLRRLLDIRAQAEGVGLVELPVPVTEILRLDLGKAPNDAIAGLNAKALYEGLQDIFANAAPPTPRPAMDREALQAA